MISTGYDNWTVEKFLRMQGYSGQLLIHLRNTEMGITVGGEPAYTIVYSDLT